MSAQPITEPDDRAEPFSLRAIIRRVVADSLYADPGVLAETVAELVPDSEVRGVLRSLLRAEVREEFYWIRQQASTSTDRGEETTTGEENSPAPPVTLTRPPGYSAKLEARRASWRAHLANRRECVAGEWKFLRDCTAEDNFTLGDQRAKQAGELSRAADEDYARGKLLLERGAETVGDLPETDLARLFTPRAEA